jgi:hypothetical protein
VTACDSLSGLAVDRGGDRLVSSNLVQNSGCVEIAFLEAFRRPNKGKLFKIRGAETESQPWTFSSRIVAFGKRLHDAVPAPTWLVEEAEQLGDW